MSATVSPAMRQLPNILTMARVLAVPFMVYLLWWIADGGPAVILSWVSTALFFVASMTDWADGVLARRWNVVTRFGKLADPLADKLITMACFVMFVPLGWLPGWLVVLILARETTVNSLRMLALSEGHLLAAGPGGKWKTVFQFIGIGLLLWHPALPMLPLFELGLLSTYLSVGFSLFSAWGYFEGYFRLPPAADSPQEGAGTS